MICLGLFDFGIMYFIMSPEQKLLLKFVLLASLGLYSYSINCKVQLR